jgi:hypothetical protein
MAVCKFSVADGMVSICAMAKIRIECDGMDDDMENCPFWNRVGSPYPKKRK